MRAAAGVVAVQMGHEHDVDILGAEADAAQVGGQAPAAVVHAEVAALFARELVALAGVDQDQPGGRLDEQRAHLHGDAVFSVGGDDPLPQQAGHEAEETAAVGQLAAIADDMAGNGADLK